MTTIKQFIDANRETSFRADLLESLAIAARVVLDGEVLVDSAKRRSISSDVLDAISVLSADLSRKTTELADDAEVEKMNARISTQCSCGKQVVDGGAA